MNVIEKMKERIELLEELAESAEEFEIKGLMNYFFKYIEGEFVAIRKNDFINYGASRLVFHLNSEIIREPWKPKHSEQYYVVNIADPRGYNLSEWLGDEIDNYRYNMGIIAKTEKEIKEKSQKILESIKNNG